jgi:hypothetical protein
MYRPAPMRLAVGMGVLVVMTLALTGCGGGGSAQQEEAKARPLPEGHQELRPGEYRSEEFEPSVSFRVGEGWLTSPPETPDVLQLEYGETAGLAFTRVEKVYEPILNPAKPTMPTLVEPPEDLVGWFQNHPYLKTDKPKPITVGGVKGQQFDLVAQVPEEHVSICGTDCVDTIKYTGSEVVFFEGDKVHAIVLEDVKGEAVYLDYGGLATDFDKVAPEAQKLVDSVKWGGS